MKALMLAAGKGRRLGAGDDAPPKVLLRIAGQTLLARHLSILAAAGIERLVMVVGYRHRDIEAELDRLGARARVELIHNPDYEKGSVVSLACLADRLREGRDFLLMDGDVLYDRRLIDRLTRTRHANCFLMDRDFEPGAEPVKLCIQDGHIVDFHKRVRNAYDFAGESVGFFRFSGEFGRRLAARAEAYLATGRREEWYEEAIRDLLMDSPAGTFGYEDVTGYPWLEIDFPEDLVRAEREVMPAIRAIEEADYGH